MSPRKFFAQLVVVGVLGALAAVVVAPAASDPPVAIAQTGLGAGGEFHPVSPVRVFDSRPPGINDTSPLGKKPMTLAGSDFKVRLAGVGGLPDDPGDILAVVANVTVVEPGAQGWLAVRPTGSSAGLSALVNFPAGRTVANLAWVGVGPDGTMTVKLRAANGSRAHVVVDVFGWISTSSVAERGTRLVATPPGRLVDTRNQGAALRGDQTLTVRVRGASSFSPTIAGIVPNSPAVKAVLVNIAAINTQRGSTATYVSATPTRVPSGATSTTANINVAAGQVKTAMAVVSIGPDGNIHLRNNAGNLHVAVDVFGYFEERPDDTTAGRVVPLDAPFRALDTREAAFGRVPLGSGSTEDWSFAAFANSVQVSTAGGTASIGAQSALIGNLTATDLRRVSASTPVSTYLTAWPAQSSRPLASNLNLAENEVVPNMSLVRYGNTKDGPNAVKVYNHNGSVHYVLDVYAVVMN